MPPTRHNLDSVFTHAPGYEIAFSELPNYTENYTRDGAEVRRTLQCNWADAYKFPIPILGDVKREDRFLSRILPHQHPHTSKKLYAVECNLINGQGAWTKDERSGLIRFSDRVNNLEGLAVWEVVYRQLTYDVYPDIVRGSNTEIYRYVTRDVKYSMENYQLPGCSMKWEERAQIGRVFGADVFANVPIPESTVKRRPYIELTYVWHWVPEPLPVSVIAFDGCGADDMIVVGRINKDDFDSPGKSKDENGKDIRIGAIVPKGVPGRHGLCDPPKISERMWTPAGTKCHDITWTVLFRPDAPWTRMWRQSTGRFEKVLPVQEGGDPLYKEGDFNAMFTYEKE